MRKKKIGWGKVKGAPPAKRVPNNKEEMRLHASYEAQKGDISGARQNAKKADRGIIGERR